MDYAAENKLPIFWIGGAVLAQLSLGPMGTAAMVLFWWGKRNTQICQRNGWIDSAPELAPRIGTQTLLGAIDVPAERITEGAPVVNVTSEIHNHIPGVPPRPVPMDVAPTQVEGSEPKKALHPVASITMGKFLMSHLFIGGSRTGKSFLVAQLLRDLRKRWGTGLTIYVLSAANRTSEAWYWEPADVRVQFDFASGPLRDRPKAYAAWNHALDDFDRIPADPQRPKLLLIDELSLVALTAEQMKDCPEAQEFWSRVLDKATVLASAGAGAGIAFWGISPNGQMGALGMQRKHAGAFQSVFIAQTPSEDPGWNQTVFQDASNNGLAPKNPPTQQEWRSVIREYNCDRVIGFKGRWHPLAEFAADPREQQRAYLEKVARLEIEPENGGNNFQNKEIPGNNFRDSEIPETTNYQGFSAFPDSGNSFPEIDLPTEIDHPATWKLCRWKLDEGSNRSQVVTDVLGCRGRKYEQGKRWLDALEAKYGGGADQTT